MSTLVALVGGPIPASPLGTNVTAEPAGRVPSDPVAAVEHLAAVWRRAARHGSVYTLVDADPFGPLVEAWADRLRGGEDHLELVIGLSSRLVVPDYYLVSPELPQPHIHWYAGHLRSLAASRVLLVEPTRFLDVLGELPYGRGLEDAATLAASARGYVPVAEAAGQPFTTPNGRSLATGAASPVSSQASTTASTSL